MSLRPRYSLLTLLVLTALVAGGVKLWYGPHHVVERPQPDIELEFSYYQGWSGQRIIDGPLIYRSFLEQDEFSNVVIVYYRNGTRINWSYEIYRVPILKTIGWLPTPTIFEPWPANPLTDQEQLKCSQLIAQERPQFLEPGVEIVNQQSPILNIPFLETIQKIKE